MRRFIWGCVLLLWMGAIASATAALMRYEATPGEAGTSVVAWPATCAVPRRGEIPTVVVAIHPRCPCSRATLEELESVLAKSATSVRIVALCCVPPEARAGWNDSTLFRRIEAIVREAGHGSENIEDVRGERAAAFGVRTSGHVLVYGADGVLRFSGGITVARGQAGDNAACDAMCSALRASGGAGGCIHTPVFGCGLVRPEACPLCGGEQ